eukprot:gene3019-3839_t
MLLRLEVLAQQFKDSAWGTMGNAVVSSVLVCLSIIDTYPKLPYREYVYPFENFLCILLALDLGIRVVGEVRGSRLRVIFSAEGALDLLTFVPTLLDAFKVYLSETNAHLIDIPALRLLRIIAEGLPFHRSLYFVITTLTTVGFGDITPETDAGRALIVAMILTGAIAIPVQIGQLNLLLEERPELIGEVPKDRQQPTIYVSTRLTDFATFRDFYEELFHEVRILRRELRLVVISSSKPSFKLRAFQEVNPTRLTLVEGTLLSAEDLTRSRADKARAFVLISDRFTQSADDEDAQTQLAVLSLKRHCPKVPLFVQVLKPSSRRALEPLLTPYRDGCMSLFEIESHFLALSTLCPGGSTLIGNLVRSVTPVGDLIRNRSMPQKNEPSTSWLAEYAEGCAYEVYAGSELKLHGAYGGMRFSVVADLIYQEHGLVLIGLCGLSPAAAPGGVLLNPSQYPLRGGEQVVVMGRTQQEDLEEKGHQSRAHAVVYLGADIGAGAGQAVGGSGGPVAEAEACSTTDAGAILTLYALEAGLTAANNVPPTPTERYDMQAKEETARRQRLSGWNPGLEAGARESRGEVPGVKVGGSGVANWQINPYYAAGQVYITSILDTYASQCVLSTTKQGGVLELVVGQMLHGLKGSNTGGLLRLQEIPPSLVGATYAAVFSYFIRHGNIAIGLYRGSVSGKAGMKGGDSGNWLPYVHTNPSPQHVLKNVDRVYILQPNEVHPCGPEVARQY